MTAVQGGFEELHVEIDLQRNPHTICCPGVCSSIAMSEQGTREPVPGLVRTGHWKLYLLMRKADPAGWHLSLLESKKRKRVIGSFPTFTSLENGDARLISHQCYGHGRS